MNPVEFLLALTWKDALDLVLLFLIVHAILRLVAGTRIVPVLLSVAFLVALNFIAKSLELVAVATLLRYFLEYVIIILIVVFHKELRRFLLQMGQRMLPVSERKTTENVITGLVEGLSLLGKENVGALVVLEGEVSVLDSCSDSGVEVDSVLSPQILVSLAAPHSLNPLHDGAVLVRGGRLIRAGLICPLGSGEGVERSFGTRHRGAIGVTEETDALALVVSEERGQVRVVIDGAISMPVGRAQIESVLIKWLDSAPNARIAAMRETGAWSGKTLIQTPKAQESGTGEVQRG